MKASEKRLLFALLGMLFLGAAVIGSDYYFDRRDLLLADKSELENDWVVIETLFEEKEVWELRSAWLALILLLMAVFWGLLPCREAL